MRVRTRLLSTDMVWDCMCGRPSHPPGLLCALFRASAFNVAQRQPAPFVIHLHLLTAALRCYALRRITHQLLWLMTVRGLFMSSYISRHLYV